MHVTQGYPTKTVRLVSSPGSASDTMARILAEKSRPAWASR
jgi:tripartite-type tricarboxylate transporter receptor subunit TctC